MKRKLFQKLIAMAVAAGCIASMTAYGSGSSGNGDVVTITYWSPRGEGTSHYSEYEDNPIIKYIKENYAFNDKKIDFDFFIAPHGITRNFMYPSA